jgi:hypothetical protein
MTGQETIPFNSPEERVLILAPTKKDGEVSQALLQQAEIPSHVCGSLQQLSAELHAGAGALVVTEDALVHSANAPLFAALRNQPAWSELPIIALVRNSVDGALDKQLKLLGHVTILERPVLLRTFLSAVQTALWARARQYQIRDLLEKERLARAEAERNSRL